MRSSTIRDGKLYVLEHPDPEPGVREVLVRVRAAGLNGADIHQLAGRYPAPPGEPQDIPGMDLAGEVVALGPKATRFSEGARVMGIVGGGPPAAIAGLPERVPRPVPERLPCVEAAGRPPVVTNPPPSHTP